MDRDYIIRDYQKQDLASLEQLYPAAFPEEDLLPLLRDLLADLDNSHSLVAEKAGKVVGHMALTVCGVSDSREKAVLLGPLAVAPNHQRSGIGSALIRAGIEQMSGRAIQMQVLGDPAYYGRFGFEPDDKLSPPFAIPKEWHSAWRYVLLSAGAERLVGQLQVPPTWAEESLWSG